MAREKHPPGGPDLRSGPRVFLSSHEWLGKKILKNGRKRSSSVENRKRFSTEDAGSPENSWNFRGTGSPPIPKESEETTEKEKICVRSQRNCLQFRWEVLPPICVFLYDPFMLLSSQNCMRGHHPRWWPGGFWGDRVGKNNDGLLNMLRRPIANVQISI